MKRHACGLLLTGLLAACSGGGGPAADQQPGSVAMAGKAHPSDTAQAVEPGKHKGFRGETSSPPDPPATTISEDRSPGLAGQDGDGNGIRDDIDQLIASRFSPTPEAHRVAEQKARALRQMLLAQTREEALRAVAQLMRSTRCLYRVLPGTTAEVTALRLSMSRELEAWTANTRERLVKYQQSNQLSGGGYFPQQPDPVCD